MKRKRKSRRVNLFPVIGKYIDTPTKAEISVVDFIPDTGNYKLTIGNLPDVTLPSCRFQVKIAEVKRKVKFFRMLKPLLEFSEGYKTIKQPTREIPLLFGLLKLRKGKQRRFILVQAADQFFKSKTINVGAVLIDNLLYLDLVSRLKEKLDK